MPRRGPWWIGDKLHAQVDGPRRPGAGARRPGGRPGRGPVLRPEQDPVPAAQVAVDQRRPLRGLLLRRPRQPRDAGPRPGREDTRVPFAPHGPRARAPGADHPLRLAQRLRADQRHARADRRQHRRFHRGAAQPGGAALHRLVRGPAARGGSRAGARDHVRPALRRLGCVPDRPAELLLGPAVVRRGPGGIPLAGPRVHRRDGDAGWHDRGLPAAAGVRRRLHDLQAGTVRGRVPGRPLRRGAAARPPAAHPIHAQFRSGLPARARHDSTPIRRAVARGPQEGVLAGRGPPGGPGPDCTAADGSQARREQPQHFAVHLASGGPHRLPLGSPPVHRRVPDVGLRREGAAAPDPRRAEPGLREHAVAAQLHRLVARRSAAGAHRQERGSGRRLHRLGRERESPEALRPQGVRCPGLPGLVAGFRFAGRGRTGRRTLGPVAAQYENRPLPPPHERRVGREGADLDAGRQRDHVLVGSRRARRAPPGEVAGRVRPVRDLPAADQGPRDRAGDRYVR